MKLTAFYSALVWLFVAFYPALGQIDVPAPSQDSVWVWDFSEEKHAFYTPAQTRTFLGLDIGTDVQAFDADLSDLADGTLSASKLESTVTLDTEWDTAAEINAATLDEDFLVDSDVGVTVQGFDADLTDLADGSLTGTKLGLVDAGAYFATDNAEAALQELGAAWLTFETSTQLNTRDTNNRARANHTGTQTLATISDAGTAAAAALIDDDTFATATASNIPSAESVKAYVDGQASGMTDLADDTTPDLGGHLGVGAYRIESTGDIALRLGDAAGTNKLSIQDSGGVEMFAFDSDGAFSAITFDVDTLLLNGSTSGTITLQAPAVAGTNTLTFPAATDTLVGKATTDTLTNKTFDANGTGNALSNVDVADLADGTDGELITWNSSGNAATVGAGTAGQVLTSNGPGAAPTFQDTSLKVYTEKHSASHTISANECYGGVHYVTAAATITLPAVADGMSVTIITVGAVAVSVDPNASDLLVLDGTTLDDGDKATNTGTTGDIIVLTYYDATGWFATSNSWTDGGA